MRPAALVALAFLLAPAARGADPTAYLAVVTDAEVKLRAGPSDAFPETGPLPRGSRVVVERDEGNGWLAVTAPPGSVSWVSTVFIEDPAPDRPTPKNVFVQADDEITLMVGKAGEAQPIDNVRRVKIPNGTTLLLLGPKATFAGKTWYPVEPPVGDVRYLPKTAVQFDKPAANTFTARVTDGPAATPAPTVPPPAPVGDPLPTTSGPGSTPVTPGVVASKPAVNHPLWTQAETAEREGRFADAEKAYFDLAALMNGTGGDHDVANLCYTRIHALREKRRAGTAGGPTGANGVLQPPSKDDRGVRPGAPQALPTATSVTTPNATTPNVTTPGGGEDAKWVGPGTLRRSPLTPDGTGKPAYALESAPGVVKAYITAGPGVDLEKALNKRVNVYGQTRNGQSKSYVVATAVEAAP